MANKLFLVSATLAFFFLLTNASIYRTIVEFDDNDANRPLGPKERLCQRDFQESEHLRACQQWMHRQMQSQFDLEDDNDRVPAEPAWPAEPAEPAWPAEPAEPAWPAEPAQPAWPAKRHPLLQRCCQELYEESPVCVCPTLKEAARAVRLQGQHGPFQASRIYRTAKHLPNVCNVQQVGVCPFQTIPFFPPY